MEVNLVNPKLTVSGTMASGCSGIRTEDIPPQCGPDGSAPGKTEPASLPEASRGYLAQAHREESSSRLTFEGKSLARLHPKPGTS